MKKFLLIALILLMNCSIAGAAQSVTDNAGLLGAAEVELLNQKIKSVESAHKIEIGVVFVKSIGNRDMITASNEILDKNFANGLNGGIILLVAMDKRKYEMSTDRRMVNIITNGDGIPFLKEKFQSALSSGDYFVAANSFIDGVDELLIYHEKNGYAYGQRAPGSFDPMAAGLAVVLSIFIGIMIRSSLIGKMSNIHHAQEAIDYLKKSTVKLTEARDTFLFMNVQRRARGGGRSSGNSHGGGGHGGGGGSF